MDDEDEIFEEFYVSLRATARSALHRSSTLSQRDATSLVHSLLLRHASSFSERAARPVVRRIALRAMRHALIDELRGHGNNLRSADSDSIKASLVAPEGNIDVQAIEKIHQALESLQARDPQAATLAEERELMGYSFLEVSERNECTVHAVRKACEELRVLVRDSAGGFGG